MKNKLNKIQTLVALELAALMLITACSPKSGVNPPTPSVTASNVKLTPEQSRNIHLYKVAPIDIQQNGRNHGGGRL